MKNLKKIFIGLVILGAIITTVSQLQATTKATTGEQYKTIPLVQLQYTKASGRVIREYSDNATWSVVDNKNNEYVCHVNDSIDDEHSFMSQEAMENFINNYYKNHKYLSSIEGLIKY